MGKGSARRCLFKVMTKIRKLKRKLSKLKFVFTAKSLTFLPHRMSGEGMLSDSLNVKAISEMPNPPPKLQLQHFLGMIVYVSKFTPNLSDRTKNDVLC